jgi:hypothetical protein
MRWESSGGNRMKSRVILIALDSVGIDPLGHNRPDSIYSRSRFLFPAAQSSFPLRIESTPIPGALVETTVAPDCSGAIECAITYTSIFSGRSALEHHGLMQGLGLNEQRLKELISQDNLFKHFESPCLANAIFPVHPTFLGTSFVQDLIPSFDRNAIEGVLTFDGQPARITGPNKHGFAELFTLAEINQNIFVHAAREADMSLRTWADVRSGDALTGTMTNELESRFNWEGLGQAALPVWSPEEAAQVLVKLARQSDFTFYKYQLPDLVSHTGRVELARGVFETIETFVEAILNSVDPARTTIIITSDHGHLEHVGFTRGHPKSKVPTWYFGPDAERQASRMGRPEGIFEVIAEEARSLIPPA